MRASGGADAVVNKDLSRRAFASKLALVASGALASSATHATMLSSPYVNKARVRPNILFVAIDDLNDMIGPLGGYPGVVTPNFNRLAKLTRSYNRAYTPAPACSPARSAILFGVQPFHSGVYTHREDWERGSAVANQTSLPKFMKSQDYLTIGTGKIFHQGWKAKTFHTEANDPTAWNHFERCESELECLTPSEEDEESDDAVILTKDLKFGPSDLSTSEMGDVLRVKWFNKNVLSKRHDRPFFGAIGLSKPHLPFYVPKRFFDLYRGDSIQYPPGVIDSINGTFDTNGDTGDLPITARSMLRQFGEEDHRLLTTGPRNYWKDIIHSYLAAISFTDHCLGLLLDGWLKGPNAENTLIVLWSDHGWQLGEKLAWRKFTLWERATRMPYMIGGSVNGRTIGSGNAQVPVSTISVFPTIADLAFRQIPAARDLGGLALDGESLKRHLLNGAQPRDAHAISTWMIETKRPQPGADESANRHFSVRTQNHRLIRYGNGDRELYNNKQDPYELNNLLSPKQINFDRHARAREMEVLLPATADCVPRARPD